MNNSVIITEISLDELKSLISDSIKEHTQHLQVPEKEKDDNELIKVKDVARLYGVSNVTIHRWKNEGFLIPYKISNKIYFKKNEVIEAMKKIERREI